VGGDWVWLQFEKTSRFYGDWIVVNAGVVCHSEASLDTFPRSGPRLLAINPAQPTPGIQSPIDAGMSGNVED
jgi:hypothetical protein